MKFTVVLREANLDCGICGAIIVKYNFDASWIIHNFALI